MTTSTIEHTLRVKIRDPLYEKLCTKAALSSPPLRPEEVAEMILSRALRRLPAADRREVAA